MLKYILSIMLSVVMLFSGFGDKSEQVDQVLKGSDGKDYQYVICTASETGSYHRAGKRLVNFLGMNRKIKAPYAVAETTNGTIQNIKLVREGICNVAFVQEDYVSYVLGSDPSFLDSRSVLTLSRTEHVQLIMRNSDNEDDLQEKGKKVLVGLSTSGGAASWSLIKKLEPKYARASTVFGDIDISSLSDLANGRIDAIIKTSHLNPSARFSRDVVKNKLVSFVDFDDNDLNDKIDLGTGEKPIYKFVNQKVASGMFGANADVLETKVVVLIDYKKMSSKQKAVLIRAISDTSNSLFN